jgi:DNA-binding response OmpR family regulator
MTQPPAIPASTLLVVEHSPAIRRLFEVLLRDVAGRVFIVEDPDGARAILGAESIDVVVLEPQGPSRLHWDLLDEFVVADIPTVVVTSRVEEEILDEAARRGATAVMTKPFHPTELEGVINAILAT